MKFNPTILVLLFPLGSLASVVMPADAQDGFHLHVRDPDTGDITSLHESEFTPDIRKRLAAPQEAPPKKLALRGAGRAVAHSKRANEGAYFENGAPWINVFELYTAIHEFGAWLGHKGTTMYHHTGTPYTEDGVCLFEVAGTWKKGETILYVCDYGKGAHVDTDTWLTQIWPAIDPGFQGNSEQMDNIKAAWYSHPDWKASYGFTKIGRRFCDRRDYCEL